MENPGTVSDPAAPDPDPGADPGRHQPPGPDGSPAQVPAPARQRVTNRRTAADWTWQLVLAMAVLAAGVLTGTTGPLMALACDTCQDGIRGPLPFGEVLNDIARYAVPLTTLGTIFGIFLSRHAARAGGIGLGVLAALLIAMTALGRFTGR
ncbi:hypothetical protein [Streptomyces sp. NPDC048638]|uniref:hypothetical protein n=1 Tax=Streptomyces sp. NPDC048638 TaxID=3365580 RepID=UPI0037223FC9